MRLVAFGTTIPDAMAERTSGFAAAMLSASFPQRVEGGIPFFFLRLRMRRNHNGLAYSDRLHRPRRRECTCQGPVHQADTAARPVHLKRACNRPQRLP